MKTPPFSVLSLMALAVSLPSARGAWGLTNADNSSTPANPTTNDSIHDYNNTAQWGGGVINDTFLNNPILPGVTLYMSADRTTVGNANGITGRGLHLAYGGNGVLTLQGNSVNGAGAHTLTLGGNVYLANAGNGTTVIGSSTAGSELYVNLGGVTRNFGGNVSGRSVRLLNTVSNGGINVVEGVRVELSGINTYAGGSTIDAGTLQTLTSGTLGLGNVTVANLTTSFLTLGNAQSIADTATVFFGNDSTIALNYGTGTETIGALYNTTQGKFMTPGTWTATDLNTFFGGDAFTGTGKFLVVPEPSTSLLGAAGLALVLARRRRQVG